MVDRQVALFGSVNLDVRSFWLDFEVTLGVYDPDFVKKLSALQAKYIENSTLLNLQTWQQRPGKERSIENLARLASPLLLSILTILFIDCGQAPLANGKFASFFAHARHIAKEEAKEIIIAPELKE